MQARCCLSDKHVEVHRTRRARPLVRRDRGRSPPRRGCCGGGVGPTVEFLGQTPPRSDRLTALPRTLGRMVSPVGDQVRLPVSAKRRLRRIAGVDPSAGPPAVHAAGAAQGHRRPGCDRTGAAHRCPAPAAREGLGQPRRRDLDYMRVVLELCRDAEGPILECGSGLTRSCSAPTRPNLSGRSRPDERWHARVSGEARAAGITGLGSSMPAARLRRVLLVRAPRGTARAVRPGRLRRPGGRMAQGRTDGAHADGRRSHHLGCRDRRRPSMVYERVAVEGWERDYGLVTEDATTPYRSIAPPESFRWRARRRGGPPRRRRQRRPRGPGRRPRAAAVWSAHGICAPALTALADSGFPGASVPSAWTPMGTGTAGLHRGRRCGTALPGLGALGSGAGVGGRLLPAFHVASASFDPSVCVSDETADPRGGTIVCHNDVCLENVVFRDGEAVGLLDFDFSAPGRPSTTWPSSPACASRSTTT